jgi:iron complex transport system permease protein
MTAIAVMTIATACGSTGCALNADTTDLLLQLRLPRVLAAFAVGGLLALAGSLLQLLLRNPLADPYVLGLSGGAAAGGSSAGAGIEAGLKGLAAGLRAFANPASLVGLGAITLAIMGIASFQARPKIFPKASSNFSPLPISSYISIKTSVPFTAAKISITWLPRE